MEHPHPPALSAVHLAQHGSVAMADRRTPSAAGDIGAATGQLGLGHTTEDVQAMFTAAVLASTPPGSVVVGQPAASSTNHGEQVTS